MMVPTETLYEVGRQDVLHRVYQHFSNQRVLVVGEGNQKESNFITPQSYQALRNAGYQHIHLGLMMVRLQTLHRREAGTMALVVI